MTGMSILEWVAIFVALYLYTTVYVTGQAVTGRLLHLSVEETVVGSGPTLFSFRCLGVPFVFRLFPLGGYTRFQDEDEPSAEERSLFGLKAPERIRVCSVGPLSQLVLGFLVLALTHWVGREEPEFVHEPARIGWCRPESALHRAGLARGDEVVAAEYDGRRSEVGSWRDFLSILTEVPERPLRLECRRGGGPVSLEVAPHRSTLFDVCHEVRPVVGSVVPSSRGMSAGFEAGDVIVEVEGKPVAHWLDIDAALTLTPAGGDNEERRPAAVKVLRGSESIVLAAAPDTADGLGSFGLRPLTEPVLRSSKTFGAAFGAALSDILESFHVFQRMMTRRGEYSSEFKNQIVLSNGYRRLCGGRFAANTSRVMVTVGLMGICLGLVNLLPIPTLNGWHIATAVVEYCRGRPISEPVRLAATYVGLLVVLSLFVWFAYAFFW